MLSDEIQINDERDEATICGARVTGDLLRAMVAANPTPTEAQADGWFRHQRREDGVVDVQWRIGMLTIPNMSDDLLYILGRPCFGCIQLAELLRFDGYAIKFKAEYEQAFVLHWLLRLYAEHGRDAWRSAASTLAKEIHQRRIDRLATVPLP